MKSVLVIYLGKRGGPAVFSLELARGFVEAGYQVSAILSSRIINKKAWDQSGLKKICYIYTGDTRHIGSASINLLFRESKRIKSIIGDEQFDFAIHTFPHPWSYWVGKIAVVRKQVMFCHDPIAHSSSKPIYAMLNHHLIKKCDEIFVLTKSFIPLVQKQYKIPKSHVHFVPHGRMGIYKECGEKHQGEVGKQGEVNFLFFGNITGYKGLLVLAEAYKKLRATLQSWQQISLTIAGSGDFTPYAKKFQELENVFIENRFIPDEEVESYFTKPNTVLILPYLDATQSGVIPIAMEFGNTVIASRTGGLYEQLDDGKLGLFYERGNSSELCEQMRRVIDEPDLINEQYKRMRIYVQNLDWDKIAVRMVEQM